MGLRERLAARMNTPGGPMEPDLRARLPFTPAALLARLEAFRAQLAPAAFAALVDLVAAVDEASYTRTLAVADAEATAAAAGLGIPAEQWTVALDGVELDVVALLGPDRAGAAYAGRSA